MGRTDAELIAACRAGQAEAFGEIVERYQRAVVGVAYAAVRDRVLAEDVAQDAFVLAWTKLSGLREVERLPAWLCGIARNVARARRRVRGREVGQTDVAGDVTPFTSLDDAEREAAVAVALARVPAAYREPLVLVYCEQQSAKDVARALGMTDAAVHQRLSRGRAMLASDAALVEHAGSRSRRSLAAAVLAAIALGVGSSRVEASPRGPIPMLKLTAIALTASLAAGTTYVVARGTHDSPTTSAPTSSVRSTSPHAAFANAADVHARGGTWHSAFAAPARPVIRAANGPATCAELANHMANLAFADDTTVPPDGALRDKILAPLVSHFDKACEHGQWSQELMTCMLGAPDAYSAMLDCGLDPTKQGGDDMMPEGGITIPTRATPIAASTDTSCAGAAKQMAALTTPDSDGLSHVPADKRDQITNAMALAHASMVRQAEKSCIDTAWPESRRKCLASATTVSEMTACQ